MKQTITAIFMILCLGGCMDQDPFGMSTRDIKGSYELEQWEDGTTYYLKGPSHITHQAWGALEGTVGKLGWTDDLILVWQNDCGSGEGWRVIDLKNSKVSQIYSQNRIDSDAELSKITVVSAEDAWNKLK